MRDSCYNARIPDRSIYENHMDISKINRLNTVQFFDSKNNIINNMLIEMCKEVFYEAYNGGGKEAGAVYNIFTRKYALYPAKNFGRVNFDDDKNTDYYRLYSKSANYSCIAIHSHNCCEGFSLTDIKTFLISVNTIAIIVVKSNATVSFMIKDKNKDYSELINRLESVYKYDVITKDIRDEMKQYGLIERSV